MNNELSQLNEKHNDTLIEQTKATPKDPFEFRINNQMQTFSINPPLNFFEEAKWLLAVTSCEATNTVFNITKENNSFSISTPGHCSPEDRKEFISKLNKLLEVRSENDLEFSIKEFKKRGTRKEIENSGYNSAEFDHFKSENLPQTKRAKYRSLEDKVYRLQLIMKKL